MLLSTTLYMRSLEKSHVEWGMRLVDGPMRMESLNKVVFSVAVLFCTLCAYANMASIKFQSML